MGNKVDVCVIPAAGEGSRWAPLSTYIPKEMLPFGNRTVIEWVVQEAVESGCRKIVIVINKKKELIRQYFRERGSKSIKKQLHFAYQNKPNGIADAIMKARGFIKDQSFTVIFPDNPATYQNPPLKQAILAHKVAGPESYVLPFAEYPKNNLIPYGECLFRKRGVNLSEIVHICPRSKNPNKSHHSGNKRRLAGRIVFPNSSLELFERVLKDCGNKNPGDGEVLKLAISLKKPVLGIKLKQCRCIYDTGTPDSYMRSVSRFFSAGNSRSPNQ